MSQEIQQGKAFPFVGPILGLGISSIFLFLFFKIPPLFLHDHGEELLGAEPVIIFSVAYVVVAAVILGYFRRNKYVDMFRVIYWSGLVIFYFASYIMLFSALSWIIMIPVVIFGFPLIIIPAGIFLFFGIEKMILQTPQENPSKHDSISISQKLNSLLLDEKPKF